MPKSELVTMYCRGCKSKIPSPKHFRNEKSLREYFISGLCQECQDDIWGPDPPTEEA